jgi:uncharacterized protein YndB with AHSA1/START domain
MASYKISKTIIINAPVKRVWEALTDPLIITQWWSDTAIKVSTTWEVGSPISFAGMWNAVQYEDKGVILKFKKEKWLSYTYLSHISQLPDIAGNYSLIEFKLTPSKNQTILELIQRNFATEVIYKHWSFYWPATLDIMKKTVENEQ